MNYKWHTRINIVVLSLLSYMLIISGAAMDFCVLFWSHGMFHTVYFSPDIDHQKSTPTKKLGVIGWAISRTFKHRGMLHSPLFWAGFYFIVCLIMYNSYGYNSCWMIGGLIAIYMHILVDRTSSEAKNIKRKLTK